jgi:hypothetical protein
MTTENKDNHNQKCPKCIVPLATLDDYIGGGYGGGNHYWILQCELCGKRYVYDTYRFQLEPYL